MRSQAKIREILQHELHVTQRKNPSFSNRALARRIGLSSGALSAFLRGKRQFSWKVARRVCEKIGLAKNELLQVERLFQRESSDPVRIEDEVSDFCEIQSDQYEAIAGWQHFAILSLLKLKNFRSDSQWIARRLGISQEEAQTSFERLVRLGLIKQLSNGAWVRSEAKYRTSDGTRSLALQQAHQKNLELAHRSITNTPIELRDLASMTMAIDPSKIEDARPLIRKALNELSDLLENSNATEVYKACFQLFPLTQKEDSQDENP